MPISDAELLSQYIASRRMASTTKRCFESTLRRYGRDVGRPLSEATMEDVSKWYKALCSRGCKPGSIILWANKLRLLSTFYLSLSMEKRAAEYLAEDLWSVVPSKDLLRESNHNRNDRDKVISTEELTALLQAAPHPRVKAFIAVLFDSGCRKTELKTLKIRDVTFGATYSEIRVTGKTGERTIPLVFSVPYLRAWLQVHPDRRLDQWLFAFERYGKVDQMKESSPNNTIRAICRKAGIRHIYPHMLRHTKLTELAKAGVGDYQMKGFAGWSLNSKMSERYIHLSGRDHINAVLESQGVEVPAQQRPKPMLSGDHCPNCDAIIGSSMLHCPSCGYILDQSLKPEQGEKILKFDQLLEELKKGREESDRRMIELEERFENRLKELHEGKAS